MSEDAGPAREDAGDTSLAAMLARFFADAETLLVQELMLMRAEIAESAGELARGAAMIIGGLAVTFVGGLAVAASVVILLSKLMPAWAASVVVGALICAVGLALVIRGRRLTSRVSLVPAQTLQSLRETGEWVRKEFS